MKKLSTILWISGFILCLGAAMGSPTKKSQVFDWQGHRGARGLFPENTIQTMIDALNYPITTLELDVVINKDKEVVVSHEPWMSEEICLDKDGKTVKDKLHNIYSMTYLEITSFDCGLKKHPRFPLQMKRAAHKPLLSDLLAKVESFLKTKKRQRLITYNIEIKSDEISESEKFQPDIKTFTDLVIQTISKQLPENRFTIQSFDWRVLNYLSNKYPKVGRVALIEEKFDVKEILKKLEALPTVFSPDYTLLTKEDVQYLHSQNIKVIPWTVNSVDDMKKVKALGVDGIITDYPNLIGEL